MTLRWRRLELLGWAFLLSLAYYPGSLGFLAWLVLIRPIHIIAHLEARPAFNAAYLFSFGFQLFSLYWVAMVTPPGMIVAVLVVALYYALALMIFRKLYRLRAVWGAVALPFLWVGVEYFRTLSEFAFPWSDLGYTQAYYGYILQFVAVASVHGLSFAIVTVNVLLWQLIRRGLSLERKLTAFFAAVAVVAALVAHGWVVTPRLSPPGEFDVALLQASIPLDKKWQEGNEYYSFHVYDSLARTVSGDSIRLFVWPETAAPAYLTHDRHGRYLIGRTVAATGAPHLVGSLAGGYRGEKLRYYNSCFQFDSLGEIQARYDKVKLVPFSEHVPYQDALPFLEKDFLRKYLTFIETYDVQWWSDFYPGDSSVVFHLPGADYAVLICFETAFPEFVRERILDGAHFVLGITNDTWFGRSVGIHMHARIFITRAVENRCWFARCANSGLTFIVDPWGAVRQELPPDEAAYLVGAVGLLEEYSTFTRYGDIVGRVSYLFTVSSAAILIALWLFGKARGVLRPPHS